VVAFHPSKRKQAARGFEMENLRRLNPRGVLEGIPRRATTFFGAIVTVCITLLGMPPGGAAQGSKESESTRSAPPDTTPYVRPAIPEDYAPSRKPAIPSKVSNEHQKAKPPATPPRDEDGAKKTKKKDQ
jgi:hypothetical protein